MHVLVVALALSLAAPAEPETLLVLDLDHSADVGDDVARTITDLVVGEVSARVKNRVLSGADIRNLTALEGEKQALGCESDSSCLAEIASAMGARYLVSGRVSTLGPELVLQLSLFDASKAEPIGRQNVRAASLPALADRLPDVVATLLSPLGAKGVTPPAIPPAVVESPVDDGEGGTSLLFWSLLGGGSAAVVMGLIGFVPATGLSLLALLDMVDVSVPADDRDAARTVFYLFAPAAAVAVVIAVAGTALVAGSLFVE